MPSIYCPYSGKHWLLADTNEEHIFPLSLGGSNDFTVRVHKDENARLNREIDAPMAASLFSAVPRNRADARGHSGKPVRAPSAGISSARGEKLEFIFMENGSLGLRNPRTKQELAAEDLQRDGLKLHYSESRLLRLRFAAKVVLGAGLRIFGPSFEKSYLQQELRDLANAGTADAVKALGEISLKVWSWPYPAAESDTAINAVLEALSKSSKATSLTIISRFTPDQILFAVGVLGELSACILAPNEQLELIDAHLVDLGVVYSFPRRKLRVQSLRDALKQLHEQLQSSEFQNSGDSAAWQCRVV